MNNNQIGNLNPNWKGGKIRLECIICKKEFITYLSTKKKFCSKRCYHIWRIGKSYTNNVGENNPMFGKHHSEESKLKISKNKIGKPSDRKGKHHSEETKQKLHDIHAGKRYSIKTEFKIGQTAGENHWCWKGGISFEPYCSKFNEWLKEQVRNRDNKVCQECGKDKEENGRKLDVHHIHYDKENCYPDLITLCCSCNSKANKNKNYWEERFMNKLKERNLLGWKPKEKTCSKLS